jgi:putative ABC transport system permease protein
MKPLSSFKYYTENRRKFITSVITVLVAVVFIYDIQCFTQSISESTYRIYANSLEKHARISPPGYDKLIPETLLDRMKSSEYVEKMIPCDFYSTSYMIPGARTGAIIYALRNEDMDYVMKKHGITIGEGRLPETGKPEVALDYRIAKNKKVNVGDKIGSKVDKSDWLDGEYTVVGILKSEDFISIRPYNITGEPLSERKQNLLYQSALLFPKENRMAVLDDFLRSLSFKEVSADTHSEVMEGHNKPDDVEQILDILCILSIVVMIISVGSSKYVQFFNRKKDFGVLNALGYSKFKIIVITLKELCAINLIGYILGVIAALIIAFIVNTMVFINIGGIGVFFSFKALVITLYIPLFISLFTFIPVNNMINKIDPILMIEKV